MVTMNIEQLGSSQLMPEFLRVYCMALYFIRGINWNEASKTKVMQRGLRKSPNLSD
jgi:hypothetical protein